MAFFGLHSFISAFIVLMHPFFVSVIEINHNEKDAVIEISVRTFTNDLEKMMGLDAKTTIDLSQANQKSKADAFIAQYLSNRLHLSINGAKSNLSYVGFEIQKESTWSYFEVKNIKQLNQLNVVCEILFGVNDQQINIFHVKSKGVRKSYELIFPKNTTQFNF